MSTTDFATGKTMTCNITSTPRLPEPLPLYPGRRDPDTASIRSSAPSYTSEAPSYHAVARPFTNGTRSLVNGTATNDGLPSQRYAHGFQPRPGGPVRNVEAHNYNVSSWSSIYCSTNARQYQNVANRRATVAGDSAQTAALVNALVSIQSPAQPDERGAPVGPPLDRIHEDEAEAINPLEDPHLVGEEAARKARAARLYRERCLRGEDALKCENKSWDFLLAQMADWDKREKSWEKFRSEVDRTKLLGRRLGLRKRSVA